MRGRRTIGFVTALVAGGALALSVFAPAGHGWNCPPGTQDNGQGCQTVPTQTQPPTEANPSPCAPAWVNSQWCGPPQTPPSSPPSEVPAQALSSSPPTFSAHALSAACRAAASRIRVPATTIRSAAGLKLVTIKLDGQTIKTLTISPAKDTFTLKNFQINTRGLKRGLHTVAVTATDSAGSVARRVFRFTICEPKAKAKFTG